MDERKVLKEMNFVRNTEEAVVNTTVISKPMTDRSVDAAAMPSPAIETPASPRKADLKHSTLKEMNSVRNTEVTLVSKPTTDVSLDPAAVSSTGIETPASPRKADLKYSTSKEMNLVRNTEEAVVSIPSTDESLDAAVIPSPAIETPASPRKADLRHSESNADVVADSLASLIKEEERLHAETVEEEENIKRQQEQVLADAGEDFQSKRYQQLEFLLNKSNAYIEFLVKRIERQRVEKKAKEEKKKSRNKGKEEKKRKESRQIATRGGAKMGQTEPEPSEKKSKRKAVGTPEGGGQKRKRRLIALGDEVEDVDESKQVKSAPENIVQVLENGDRIFKNELVHVDQPSLFEGGILRDYQVEGYNWLKNIYESGVNGILADEMGLGKTIQVIAIISYLVEMRVVGPFLVVGPLSTVPNWVSEFRKFTPKLSVILYHGSQSEREQLQAKMCRLHKVKPGISTYPVVVTSYEVIMKDRKALQHLEFKYLVIDEGHRVKNSQCRLLKELKMYQTTYRLLLTGTPLQNNLAELWSLLNFLLPEIFDNLGMFESWFNIEDIIRSDANEKIVADERENNILAMLHQLLKPFLLRRLKSDVSLVIPPKKELLVFTPLAVEQKKLYDMAIDRTLAQLVEKKRLDVTNIDFTEGRPERKTKKVNYSMYLGDSQTDESSQEIEKWCEDLVKIQDENSKAPEKEKRKSVVNIKMTNIMMLLRKCVNHPYLLEYPLDDDENFLVDENIVKSCGKMQVLDSMLKELKARGHKVLIFSQMTQMLNIIEDYCSLREYEYCRLDGSMGLKDRNEQMLKFNNNPEIFLFLLSTRAGGLGINLTAADTVIIYDSDWNPQADLQAQDRCHRIGQTVPVIIYRLVTRNTIDQRVVERAAAKRKLEKMIIHKEKFKNGMESFKKELLGLDPSELMTLLQSKDYQGEVEESQALSAEMLDQLLSRDDLYEQWKLVLSPEMQEKYLKNRPKPSKTKGTLTAVDTEKIFKVVGDGTNDLAHI
ncbi:lymphocyte-specific helicase-like [Tubulanus polymorphus]|uniref:lymphocyte-specific helicase-like n=1 Tax=Tubulanus polymorphus TaxID=672921 RepID=UPI003DA5C53E